MTKKMVYLVEDDPDISEMIAYVLNDAGYDVESCGSVSCFNEKMRGVKPDIYILDILLPDGNGLDICRRLRAKAVTAVTPILVMSAHQSRQDIVAEACVDDFIAKPFNIDIFRQRVDQLTGI